MRNYEVTFIVDPVLSGDEIQGTAQKYVDFLQQNGCKIVHVDEMGLRQLAYPINKRTSGIYYCIEYQAPNGEVIDPLELNMRRDERIMRFLTVKLDKYGVKYNQDKREGKIPPSKKRIKLGSETVKAQKPKPPQSPHGDNLKRIEGIGPKVSEVLKKAGITTFKQLAEMTPEQISEILASEGDRFVNQDTSTWPRQAELAAKGEWEALRAWQEDMKTQRAAQQPKKKEDDETAHAEEEE